jgi:surfeit locus 1 family protein
MFHPGLLIVPAFLLLLSAGFASLGRWQLERAEVNREIEQRFDRALGQPALDRPPGSADVDAHRFRRITLSGRYRADVQVLLDNMTRDGRVGYEVLTPFAVNGFDRLVVVNRGWVPAAASRDELPDIGLADAAVTLRGRIDRLPRAGLRLGAEAEPSDRPVVVMSYPDFDDLETALGRELFPFQLLLEQSADSGYLRDWAAPRDLDDRNLAYAVQWFALAALALVLAVGVAIRSRHRGVSRAAR